MQNYDNYVLHSVRKMSSTCVMPFFCVGSKYSTNMTLLLLGRRLRTNSLENDFLSGAWGAQVPILGSCSVPQGFDPSPLYRRTIIITYGQLDESKQSLLANSHFKKTN